MAMIRGEPRWLLYECIQMCAHTCACWWAAWGRTGVNQQSESRTVYHLQCQFKACWFRFGKAGEAASHSHNCVCVCACACVQGRGPNWCIRGWEEWSQTCARGQGQRSLYTNTPREIKCVNAPGPVGPFDEHSHSEHHGCFPPPSSLSSQSSSSPSSWRPGCCHVSSLFTPTVTGKHVINSLILKCGQDSQRALALAMGSARGTKTSA